MIRMLHLAILFHVLFIQHHQCAESISLKLKGKKGIGMTTKNDSSLSARIARIQYLRPYWHYNWGRYDPNIFKNSSNTTKLDFFPMMWGCYNNGTNTSFTDKFVSDIRPGIDSGRFKRLLGYNEPDSEKQANITVSKAVECWPALQDTGLLLGAPVVANNAGTWLPEWRQAATNLGFRTDYTTLHYYGSTSASAFKNKVEQVYNENGQKKVLITEFAPADWLATSVATNKYTQAQVLTFMKEVVPWLEGTSWVAGYAWFPFKFDDVAGACSALFDSQGNPTALARYYSTVRNNNRQGDQTITV